MQGNCFAPMRRSIHQKEEGIVFSYCVRGFNKCKQSYKCRSIQMLTFFNAISHLSCAATRQQQPVERIELVQLLYITCKDTIECIDANTKCIEIGRKNSKIVICYDLIIKHL